MTETITKPVSKRLLSLDALRGFDMLLISGGGAFVTLLHGKTGLAWVDAISAQLEHPSWHGFTFYDFIMPLFLFMAGVSFAYSISKAQNNGLSKSSIYRKSFYRMVILILLGILYKNAPIPFTEPTQIRLGSVLGRIGIATFITTILYLNYSRNHRLIWIAGILISYYAALFLIPVPGYGSGDLSFEGNLVGWFDRNFMPGRLLQGTYDELAILTQFPALCLTLFGSLAGELILNKKGQNDLVKNLFLSGIVLSVIGLFWSLHFPINKHLWTSSFILLTAGMAFMFLVAFYWIIEVKGLRKLAFYLKVIGVNSLLIYLIYRFINFNYTSKLLFGGIFDIFPDKWFDVLQSLGALLLVWIFLYICYRRKIFLKV